MTQLPLPALVGVEHAQQALILLAIEPRLRGVAIAAPAGTGKSSLARGFRALLGDAVPFVEIPASVDAENLLGGLDLAATLRTGAPVTRQGTLARAHGGAAYVDGLNLLPDASVNHMLAALDEGEIRVEREGISLCEPAHFTLIGSYDPAEGQPRRHLLDRLGLLVTLPGTMSTRERAQVIRHNLHPAEAEWQSDAEFLRGIVQAARAHLPDVVISPAQIEQLSTTALHYGAEGHRVDLFAVWAACAAAAYELRPSVTAADLELATRLVILPRATRIPEEAPPPPPPPQQQPAPPENSADQPPPDDALDPPDDQSDDAPPPDAAPDPLMPEQVLDALANDLPAELDELPFRDLRRGRSGSRGTVEGDRGRHVRSVPGTPGRIDIAATLRAAAPWQRVRHANGHVELRTDDLRIKQYRGKAGALFCFAVDASGSMALHRMRQAKGAVHKLLEQAYVNRDQVALIAFRGEQADLLMPPTQSVELARRALDLLPTGGGTPLASALLLADQVAEQAKGRGIMQMVLILLTDGRGNIGLRADSTPQADLEQAAGHIASTRMHTIVVDTKRSYLSRGEARRLADLLGGDYAYLPNATGEDIAGVAAGAVRE